MANFKISANNGAQVERTTTLFERSYRGGYRSWTIQSRYDSGHVYCDGNSLPNDSEPTICDTRLGCAMGKLIDVEFTFDEAFTDSDKQNLMNTWSTLIDNESKWFIEEDYIRVDGPVVVKLVAENVEHQAA